MSDELIRWARERAAIPKHDRAVAAEAKKTYDQVRLSDLKVDGAMALASHIMEGLTDLDGQRRLLAQGDQVLDAILTRIEVNAVRAVNKIQNNLYNGWDAQ